MQSVELIVGSLYVSRLWAWFTRTLVTALVIELLNLAKYADEKSDCRSGFVDLHWRVFLVLFLDFSKSIIYWVRDSSSFLVFVLCFNLFAVRLLRFN